MNIETANRLLNYRKYNKLSQEDLAEKIGVSRQAVSKWERAETSPDTDNLITLAKIYGVTLDELLNSTPEDVAESKKSKTDNTAENADTPIDNNNSKGDSVSFNGGIHVNAKNGDNVDISFKDGVHVDTSQGNHVHIAKGKVKVTDKDGNVKEHTPPSWAQIMLALPFPIIMTAIFLIWGFSGVYGGWSCAWLSFLTIPIYFSVIDCFKYKDANRFAFPVFAALVYCAIGFYMNLWHPTWVIFLVIPVYYFICSGINNIINKNKENSEEASDSTSNKSDS